jgi:DNA-directed RNA polymerase sigma subunit (sigma70/sigma32)
MVFDRQIEDNHSSRIHTINYTTTGRSIHIMYKKKPKTAEEEELEWVRQMQLLAGVKAHTPMTLEEIGAIMGCTRERIRQIEVKALRKLKRGLINRGVLKYSDISADTHGITNPYTED